MVEHAAGNAREHGSHARRSIRFQEDGRYIGYERKNGDRWELADDFQAGSVRKPHEITITADNEILY